jgi:hypothetical protein
MRSAFSTGKSPLLAAIRMVSLSQGATTVRISLEALRLSQAAVLLPLLSESRANLKSHDFGMS